MRASLCGVTYAQLFEFATEYVIYWAYYIA